MHNMTAEKSQMVSAPAATIPAEDALLLALMARITQRDQTALAELYDATVARIFAVAQRITRQTTAAEEVVADVFLQVWQRSERYDGERGRVITWLLTICRSRALDWLRRRDTAELHEDPESLRSEAKESDDEPFALLDALERGTDIHAALAKLNERERQLIGLAFFRGLTHQEVADHASLPLGTVKTIIRNALLTLREQLQHHRFEEGSQ
jgi:RNA polymerase sigma-70 factor (ECF subfamily)